MSQPEQAMRHMHGVISAVQEGRFHLRTPEGRTRMFVLSHKAPVEPQDLPALYRAGTPVVVSYGPAEDVIADAAYDVAPL